MNSIKLSFLIEEKENKYYVLEINLIILILKMFFNSENYLEIKNRIHC